MGAPQFTPDLSTDLVSRSERRHPGAGFLDERSRSDDAHSRTRAKVPDVVRDEETRSGANRRGEDWDVLRISELARTFTVVRRRLMDLDGTERRNSSKSGAASGSLATRFLRTSATAASGRTRRRRPISPSTRIAWLAPVRDSRPAIRTSASTQTGN